MIYPAPGEGAEGALPRQGLSPEPNQAIRRAGGQQNANADEQGGVLAMHRPEKLCGHVRPMGLAGRFLGAEAKGVLGQALPSQKEARRKQQRKTACQHEP